MLKFNFFRKGSGNSFSTKAVYDVSPFLNIMHEIVEDISTQSKFELKIKQFWF